MELLKLNQNLQLVAELNELVNNLDPDELFTKIRSNEINISEYETKIDSLIELIDSLKSLRYRDSEEARKPLRRIKEVHKDIFETTLNNATGSASSLNKWKKRLVKGVENCKFLLDLYKLENYAADISEANLPLDSTNAIYTSPAPGIIIDEASMVSESTAELLSNITDTNIITIGDATENSIITTNETEQELLDEIKNELTEDLEEPATKFTLSQESSTNPIVEKELDAQREENFKLLAEKEELREVLGQRDKLNNDLNSDINDVNKRNAELTSALEKKIDEYSILLKDNEEVSKENMVINKSLDKANKEVTRLTEHCATLEQQLSRAQEAINDYDNYKAKYEEEIKNKEAEKTIYKESLTKLVTLTRSNPDSKLILDTFTSDFTGTKSFETVLILAEQVSNLTKELEKVNQSNENKLDDTNNSFLSKIANFLKGK